MRSYVIAVWTLVAFYGRVSAQHVHAPPADSATAQAMSTMSMMPSPLDVPETREGSGTTWLPSATPMYARHWQRSGWELMLHGNVFGQYIAESGERGKQQFGSVNWVMGMAHRELAGGKLGLHAMFSADALTVGKCGYPDILATGEICNHEPLHDQQHPHDLFMELTAGYEHALSRNLAFQIYGGPVGEPALGPVAYPHRVSAMPGPSAPIGHHWMDATHISFGVISAGLYGRKWKAEGSVFNGREPDDKRFNFDLAPLDSYSGRVWYLPSDNWALQVSAGHLAEAEPGRAPGEAARDIDRQTASATYHRPFAAGGIWATTAVWGRNTHNGHATNAFLVETDVNLAERNVFLARWESAQKTGEDLVLSARPDYTDRAFNVHKLSFGYLRKLGHLAGFVPAIGIQENVSFLPTALKPFYGTRTPAGIAVFVNLRAAPMAAHAMAGMEATSMAPDKSMTAMPEQAAPGARTDSMAMHQHDAVAEKDTMKAMQHADMPASLHDSMPGMKSGAVHSEEHPGMGEMHRTSADTTNVRGLYERMMADSVIRRRVLADTALHRMLTRLLTPGDSSHAAMHMAQPLAHPKAAAQRPAKKHVAKPASGKASAQAKPKAKKKPPAQPGTGKMKM
jgi:hypothetical protein